MRCLSRFTFWLHWKRVEYNSIRKEKRNGIIINPLPPGNNGSVPGQSFSSDGRAKGANTVGPAGQKRLGGELSPLA